MREYDGNLFPSFASDSQIYIRGIATIHTYQDGTQLQLACSSWGDQSKFNHKEYGFILDLPVNRFKPMLDYLTQIGAGNDWMEETRWMGEE